MSRDTNVIVKEIYPIIEKQMKTSTNKYKQCVARSIEKRSEGLYEIAPFDRLYFGGDDVDDFFKTLNIDKKDIREKLSRTYYWSIPNFYPAAALDEFTIANIAIVRYFMKNKMKKELELASIYLAFSGKFYPSIHYGSFPKVQPSEHRHVMEYVVNEMSASFGLKKYGSVFGAVKAICETWYDTYADRIMDLSDEDAVYVIQQLHIRIKSMMKNVAELYYAAYENKDRLTFDSDNMSEDNYHVADSDSLKVEREVSAAMSTLTTMKPDYKSCKTAADGNIKTDELMRIVSVIQDDNTNIPILSEYARLSISDYYNKTNSKDIRDIKYLSYSMASKPSATNPAIVRQKEIIEKLLDENSVEFKKKKNREATARAYRKALNSYLILTIYNSNK